MPQLRILELFSGIGGMHLALKESKIDALVVGAVDINTSANEVYKHNFPDTNLMQKNIEALSAKLIADLKPDMILMSPPCQPFTRSGKRQDVADTRCMPLIHFLELLPKLYGVRYILLENVMGFGTSVARSELVQILGENLFDVQEFELCPTQFHIPNRRLRYYLLAKRRPWKFLHQSPELAKELPVSLQDSDCNERPFNGLLSELNAKHRSLAMEEYCYPLSEVLEDLPDDAEHAVPDKLLERYIWETDLVGTESRQSCCFTKAYRRYYLGTGSILVPTSQDQIGQVFQNFVDAAPLSPEEVGQVRALKPRFFTPREILRLLCFPESFTFPAQMSSRQTSALLGNSINVHVVGLLIAYLTQ